MAEKSAPTGNFAGEEEEPIDVQRRAIREAVQRRLRVVRESPATDNSRRRRPGRRTRYADGDLLCDLAFNPLIDSEW